MSGSPASPSSSAPLGSPLHHPSHCTAPRPARATKLRGRLSRLPLKKAPWPQGAWPLGGTHSVRRQRSKRRAAKGQHPSVRQDGRTATPSLTPAGSSSRALRAALEARAALIAANELLRYRPVDNVYEEWLDRVAELVRAAGGSPVLFFSLYRAPPCAGNEAPGAPQPPPPQEGALAPRRMAPRRNPLRSAPAQQEKSCQEIPRPQEAARVLPAPARHDRAPAPARQDPALLLVAAHRGFQD